MAGLLIGRTAICGRFGGTGSVSGTVLRASEPGVNVAGKYSVRLHERRTGFLVRSTISDANGSFAFHNIKHTHYLLVSIDHNTEPKTAAVSDMVIPE